MSFNAEVGLTFVCGVVVTWLLQQFLKRTLGTRYRTQSQCDECSVRNTMNVIRSLVVELAIKAGVPPHEVAKIVSQMGGQETGGCK